MKKLLISMLVLFTMSLGYSQGTVKGQILDGASGSPLIGATIFLVGTSKASITDLDGNYIITDVAAGEYNLEMSYLGYGTTYYPVSVIDGNNQVAAVELTESGVGLESVVITGVMDIVQDRRTPVAVSTISAAEIQAKTVGNVELPEVAKATPSIYVAGQAGGYGDSEVFTRGFDQTNTAFLLNGQPINGMEDGKMYWSNWSGLTDVASAVQIQRGLGASSLAISSVGGTWNFIMKATENKKGGNVFTTIGNDNYRKVGASYSTGLINGKFGVTALLSAWSGDGWAHGTKGQGQTYFLSMGYKPSVKHDINLLVTGAPQWHDQKYRTSISNHEDVNGEIDPRYNGNWGTYDGRYFSERRNYYHKPVMNLNWEWDINDVSNFSSVLYGSLGRGGGTGGLGDGRIRTSGGLIDFDAIADQNLADPDGIANSGDYEIISDFRGDPTDANYIRRASVNSHNWFGSVLKYNRILGENLSINVGSDLRRYYGDHYRQVVNLLGADSYRQAGRAGIEGHDATTEYNANPWDALFNPAPENERIAYNNAETIRYAGLFGQLEYSKNALTAYVQGAISTQDHVRHELFYNAPGEEDSEKVVNNGYNAKLGLSYTLTDNHSLFINSGLYSRQPFHDNVFVGNSNVVNEFTNNEQIIGLELGYKFVSENIYANLNLYRSAWNDRVDFNSLQVDENGVVALLNNESYTAIGEDPYELIFQDQLHQGVEIDLGVVASSKLDIKAFASVGSWEVVGDRDVQLFDGVDARNKVNDYVVTGDNVKVGAAPQTSFGFGAKYDISNDFTAEVNYFNYSKIYTDNGAIELPSYSLVDLNLSYLIKLDNGSLMRIGGNVYNLLDELYISRMTSSDAASTTESDNWNGINKSNSVAFGTTRTWNLTLKYSY